MRKKPNLDKRLARCEKIIPKELEKLSGVWKKTYGHKKLCLEIGCGKGLFITETAKCNKDILFVGIEREPGALVMAAEKALEQGIENVVFIDADAEKICEIFSEGEVDGIYLNFSDPWPRKKQAKRRLTHEGFLSLYDKVLCEDGFIFFKTDNQKLFEFSLNSMSEYGLLLRNISLDLKASGIDNIMTEYETRFTEMGMNIYRVEGYKSQGGISVEKPAQTL